MIGDVGTLVVECPRCGCVGEHALDRQYRGEADNLAPCVATCIGCGESFDVIP